ncbi:MAG: metallopeptidase TldD-related protein [Deltaproteobacteria bacterium]|nr:metallopeptidase TldD-related protein [Deltaproteobacteria bacterium]
MASNKLEGVGARFGAVDQDVDRLRRDMYVEVRVGGYEMDSSGKGGYRFDFDPDADYKDTQRQFFGPLEDDTEAIRAQFWLATDQAYKNALSFFLGKKAGMIYKADTPDDEKFDDFSREKAHRYVGPEATIAFDKEKWTDFVRSLSEELMRDEEVVEHEIRVNAQTETRYYVNSEGTEIISSDALISFYAYGRAYADDGMELQNNIVRYAGSNEYMRTFEQLREDTLQMVAELKALRKAPVIDPYTGPAILDAYTTGVFFHEAIGHRLEGERMRDTQEGQTFKGKVGQKILPEFVSVYDDPTQRVAQGEELNGHYEYDNEGVPAQRVTLVKNGELKSYLLSRAPVAGFKHSNGHGRSDGRADPMGRMAVTIVSPSETLTSEGLKQKLIEEVRRQGKPYGLILRRSEGGETSTGRVNFQAFANRPKLIYKVDPDTGEEMLVRGAELVGTPLISISKIIAMDDTPGVFNGFCGAESGMIPVSATAPAALVSEIELQRSSAQPKRPPILPAPF